MKIAIANDHGGLDYKNKIKEYLIKNNHSVLDMGTNSLESCHYPIFAKKAITSMLNNEVERIILVCTTGEGMCMYANRFKGVRCGIPYEDDVCVLMREHNNANALAIGQKYMKIDDVYKRIEIFLNTPFLGGRHLSRIAMFDE